MTQRLRSALAARIVVDVFVTVGEACIAIGTPTRDTAGSIGKGSPKADTNAWSLSLTSISRNSKSDV